MGNSKDTQRKNYLEQRKDELMMKQADSNRQISATLKTANNIISDLTGISPDQMQTIAEDKRKISDKVGLKKAADQVKQNARSGVASTRESQKLVKQLNTINKSDIDNEQNTRLDDTRSQIRRTERRTGQAIASTTTGTTTGTTSGTTTTTTSGTTSGTTTGQSTSNFDSTLSRIVSDDINTKFSDMKVQSAKCRALISRAKDQGIIEGFGADPDPESTIQMILQNHHDCPEIRALARNIITSKAEKDPKLVFIIQRAKDEGQDNSLKYRKFLHHVLTNEINEDRINRRTLSCLLADNAGLMKHVMHRHKYPIKNPAIPVYL